MYRARSWAIAFLIIACFAGFPAAGQSDAKTRLLAAYNATIDDPWNEAKLSALLDLLPTLDGYYLVEGDLPMSRREVQQTIVDARGARQSGVQTGSPGELIVITVSGVAQLYPPGESRKLSYAIDKASFDVAQPGAYGELRNALAVATADWEELCGQCGIEFVFDENTNPQEGDVWFIARYIDQNFIDQIFTGYIASAFFPHWHVERRYLKIYPNFFQTEYDHIGMVRHELGHVLGYRHEHTREVQGCAIENDEWHALTPYDPHSVMHYVCGDAGEYKLEFTTSDREGHKRLYMPVDNEG